MTSTPGDTTIKVRPDVPAIVCGECGFRTARVASLIDSAGHETGTAIVCHPCRERERARVASAAAASTSARRTAGRSGTTRAAGRPGAGTVPHQRCAPPARSSADARTTAAAPPPPTRP